MSVWVPGSWVPSPCLFVSFSLWCFHQRENNCLFASPQAFTPIHHFTIALGFPTIPLSATFPHPPPPCICFPSIFSFSLPHRLLPSTLSSRFLFSPLYTPPTHPISPIPLFPFSIFPLLAFLRSGPICSHYTDGPYDSVEWCTLSPVPLQGLSQQLGSFSVGTMSVWHFLLSLLTSRRLSRNWSSYGSQGDLWTAALCRCKCRCKRLMH